MPDKELRFFKAEELRAEEKDGKKTISGYTALFNSRSLDLGGFYEEIAPGAFANTITQDDVRALFNHNPSQILGRNKAGTLMCREDARGLFVSIDVPDTANGRDAWTSIKRGDVTGQSFGFETIRDSWGKTAEGRSLRTLEEVKLYDVGPVTYPAYPDTVVSARAIEHAKPIAPPPSGNVDLERRRLELAAAENDEAVPAEELPAIPPGAQRMMKPVLARKELRDAMGSMGGDESSDDMNSLMSDCMQACWNVSGDTGACVAYCVSHDGLSDCLQAALVCGAVCSALLQTLYQGLPIKELCLLTAKLCKACAKICNADDSACCQDCADSCAACADACTALAG